MMFMDFCAGIGGGRLGLENIGLKCVGFSEIDKSASLTYSLLFGDSEKNYGDLMAVDPNKLPYFDLMIAGFPCQSFSIVGRRKGLADPRGTIIYGLIKVLKARRIKYFLFENVKGLVNHDKGQTFATILEELNKAGYMVEWRVLNSLDYGVPQMRERVYLVGVRHDLVQTGREFSWPTKVKTPELDLYLIDTENRELRFQTDRTFNKFLDNKYNNGKYNVSSFLEEDYLVIDTRQSDLRLYRGCVPTLRSGRHGILYVKNRTIRRMSGYESLLLQGFSPKMGLKLKNQVAETRLLSQAGNAMTVPVISLIAEQLVKYTHSRVYPVA